MPNKMMAVTTGIQRICCLETPTSNCSYTMALNIEHLQKYCVQYTLSM